jgi:hypothetical protein
MKKIFTLCWLAASLTSLAQTSTVFQDNMNVIYQYVDRTPVTTGLLLDYGLLLTDVAAYNGTLQANNYVNRAAWSSLYASLFQMKFNNNASLPLPASVESQINDGLLADGAIRSTDLVGDYLAENNTVVHLVGLHYQYQQFRADAATAGLVYVVNNQIYDTPGRSASPYEIKDAFAIAPTTVHLQGNNHVFRLRPDLFFTNVSKPITSLRADFGDGLGLRAVGTGTDVNVTYTTDSVKTVIFQLAYADGQVLQSRTLVNVSGTTKICSTCRYTAPQSYSFPKAGASFPVAADQMGKGTVTVATSGTDGKLDKPLIIVEGFDPFNQYNYTSLILDKYSLAVKVNVDFPNQTFSQLLEANNYDLVFLDFANSTDDIKRNAYLLENIIYWVNQQVAANGSTQKNVVLGISMGGLVARYALRDMEVRNVNHNTRLYCSIDSPHQGANVPLGVQAAVRYLGQFSVTVDGITLFELSPDISKAKKILNSPAAKQMLIYQMREDFVFDNSAHDTFQRDYAALGMPRLWGIRNIAVANGAECGTTQGFSPYSQLLTASGTQKKEFVAGLLLSLAQSGVSGNPLQFFEGFLTFNSNLQLTMEIRALPDQQVQRIFYLDLYYHKEILFGLAQGGSSLLHSVYFSSASMLPLDSNPGGIYNVNKFAQLPSNISGYNLSPLITSFNFVPTSSSLDVGSGTQTIGRTDYLRTYSPLVPPAAPKNVPFHNFFTNPLSNENHATLTINNAKWLWNEMKGTPAISSCSYRCANTDLVPVISGPALVCTQATYSVSPLPAGVSVQYYSSNNSGITMSPLSSDPTKGVANHINGYQGNITLSAQVTGSCGSAPTNSITVYTDNPLATINTLIYVSGSRGVNPITLTPGGTYRFQCDAVPGATSYTWVLPSGFSFYSGAGTATPYINTSLTNGSYSLFCSANNACGASWTNSLNIFVSTGSSGGGGSGGGGKKPPIARVAYFPNPSNSGLTISFTDSLAHSDAGETYEVYLVDALGREMFYQKASGSKTEIPLEHLKPDIYFLVVKRKDDIWRESILVSH